MTALAELLAEQFWLSAVGTGRPDSYPANIERAAILALPASVVKLSSVTADAVRAWLLARGIAALVPPCADELSGCVAAYRGHAIIFACGCDPDDEVRITIAHEVAHVLRHYLRPRQAAVETSGQAILQVLDGDREATFRERVQSVLASVPLGAHVHMMPRGPRPAAVAQVEREADELALELIAPRAAVGELLASSRAPCEPRDLRAAVGAHFGVPAQSLRPLIPDAKPERSDRLEYLFTSLRRKT